LLLLLLLLLATAGDEVFGEKAVLDGDVASFGRAPVAPAAAVTAEE